MGFTELRQNAATKLAARPEFAEVRTDDQTPEISKPGVVLRVHLRRGRLTADGDANTGVPSFDRVATIAIDLFRVGGTGLETSAEGDVDLILKTLLTDPDFLANIEGVLSISIDFEPRREGQHRAIDAAIEIEIQDFIDFEPVITDDLEAVRVETTGDTPKPVVEIDNLQA